MLDVLEGQYCNRNCIGCSVFSLVTAGFTSFSVGLASFEYEQPSVHPV